MRFDDLKKYLYVPPAGKNPGIVYLLGERTDNPQNSLVIIPYTDASKNVPDPEYYPLSGAIRWEFPPYLAYTDVETPVTLKQRTPKDEYIRTVNGLKQHIQRGDIYEINYCIEFYAENVKIDPFNTFMKLNDASRAPFSYLVKLDDEYIICCSPELYLRKKSNRVITKPVKGTIRRGRNAEEDAMLKKELAESLKDRTENVMAVDVARNDLSRFAKKGSVKVQKLFGVESFQTVHQMVTTVVCEPRKEVSFQDMIIASFPMASMTGAPKHRAMQIISESENFSRHYYSGALGFHQEKEFRLAVVIRSIFFNRASGRLSFAVGSAITHLSDPEKEYDECMLKAQTMMKALNGRLG